MEREKLFPIGLPAATLIKLKSKENLNSSNLTLSDKEVAQRWIEVADDYQKSCALEIAFKSLETLVNETLRTLNINKQAREEIANHGFQTELAEELISQGEFLSKVKEAINLIPKINKVKDRVKDSLNLIKEFRETANEIEFTKSISILIKLQSLIVDKIEPNLIKDKDLINNIRKNVLNLNKKNVKFFIKHEKVKEGHRLINKEINKLLKRIKAIQQELHNNNNCCDECRFC